MIRLFHLPPAELNPNKLRRLHWSKRSSEIRIARQEMYYEALGCKNGRGPIKKARIHYKFIIAGKRRHDLDNMLACCKPYVDGIVDAGIIEADDILHLEIGSVKAEYGKDNETIIIIEDITG